VIELGPDLEPSALSAMVAEVVHGAPFRFATRDDSRSHTAARTATRSLYRCGSTNETICVLKSAVRNAKLGRDEEVGAIKRLDEQARLLERCASGPPIEELIAQERAQLHNYGGRSVFGWAPTPVSSHHAERDRERAAES